MSSALSRSTDTARKGLIVFVIFIILVFVCQFVVELIGGKPKINITPVPSTGYLAVDNALGSIPKPQIQSLTLAPGTNARFALDGELPQYPLSISVYEIQKPREFLGKVGDARRTAASFGFENQENRLADNVLFWESAGQTRTLTYNKVTQEWNLDVNRQTDPEVQKPKELLSSIDEYKAIAPSLLSQVGLTSASTGKYFTGAKSRVDFINFNADNSIRKEIDSRVAEHVRVALYKKVEAISLKENFRPDADDENPPETVFAEVRTSDFLDGIANFIIRGDGKDVVEDYLHFDYTEFEYGDKGVYTMISTEQAWNKIQANQGILYWLRPEDRDVFSGNFGELNVTDFEFDVDSVRPIYIEPESWDQNNLSTQYLQPFFIFEGIAQLNDGRQAEFAFLVDALSDYSYLAQP